MQHVPNAQRETPHLKIVVKTEPPKSGAGALQEAATTGRKRKRKMATKDADADA